MTQHILIGVAVILTWAASRLDLLSERRRFDRAVAEWTKERQDLLNRIQAPDLSNYFALRHAYEQPATMEPVDTRWLHDEFGLMSEVDSPPAGE